MPDRNDIIWADNPDIEGGPIQLQRSALPFHAGYVEVDEPPPPTFPDDDESEGKSGQPTKKAAKSADKPKEK